MPHMDEGNVWILLYNVQNITPGPFSEVTLHIRAFFVIIFSINFDLCLSLLLIVPHSRKL